MRADRRDTDSPVGRLADTGRDARILPFRLQDSSAGFSLALQRQRSVTHDRESKQAQEPKARKPASPQTTPADAKISTASDSLVASEGTPQPLLSLLSALGSRCEYVDPATAQHARAFRPKKALADPESSHCIEVAHPRTGMTFRLSQKDGVWLLSIDEQSSLDPAELQPFLSYLREQFAEKGLGPVDLI
jgi:hypothetical protein